MEIFTIGFAGKSAPNFFGILKQAGIGRLIDIRLNKTSQLAGFTKSDSLPFFLRELCASDYVHEPLLAPTQEILDDYRKKRISWDKFEARFVELLESRKVETTVSKALFDVPAVLLCSESEPKKCHRRLVAEYLASKWGGIMITHL